MKALVGASMLAMAISLALAGCVPAAETPPGSAATSSQSPDARPTRSTAPTVGPVATTPSGRPVAERDVYELCKTRSLEFSGPRKDLVSFAPFDEAMIVKRNDGDYFVYIETTNQNVPEHPDGAAECIIGGTVGSPTIPLYGATERLDKATIDPNQSIPSDGD